MKRKHTTLILLWIVFCLPLTACAIGSLKYSAEPIEAWVVDAETKQPVEGAIVVAQWVLEGGMHWDRVGTLQIMETMTDQKGRFLFPAWGPLKTRKGRLGSYDPKILIFKSGYEYQGLSNYQDNTPERNFGKYFPMRNSLWNGKTIELKPFKVALEELEAVREQAQKDYRRQTGQENPYLSPNLFPRTPMEAYAKHLSFIMTSLRFIEDDCNWKKTPRMILALQKQTEIFRDAGIIRTFYSVDYLPTNETKCGSSKVFFQSVAP